MYKTESILGLIGSILATVFTGLTVIGTFLAVFFIEYLGPQIFEMVDHYTPVKDWVLHEWNLNSFLNVASVAIIVCVGVGIIIAAASLILGFMGTAKLKRDDKNGGVLLIVAGALSFISVIGFIPFVLFIVGGIMAVSKKQPSIAPSDAVKTA